MEMDPHSLVPPYFTAGVGADLASRADLVNVPTKSCAAEMNQGPCFSPGQA